MRLIHYSSEPLGPIRAGKQTPTVSFHEKPAGLWVSVEGDDGWRAWCEGEGFRVGRLTVEHEITLADGASLLTIKDAAGIDSLTNEYGVASVFGPALIGIDWQRVAIRYQGIIIAPYIHERRLDPLWYYTWDCASGCIWDPAAIASVEVIPAITGP